MKILVISHKYPPSIGGMQKQCYELVQGLQRNHEVVKLIYGSGSKFGFLLRSAFGARKLLKQHQDIDLIYANDGLMAFFLTPLFWMTKVPIAVTAHGLDVVFPLGLYQWWVPRYFNKAKAMIAVSEGTTRELLARRVEQDRVFTIRNGFDPNEVKEGADRPFLEHKCGVSLKGKKIIVSIGRSVKRKGFSWFIANVLPHLGEDVVYVIIGPKLGDYGKVNRMRKYLPASLFNTMVLLEGIPLDEITVQEKIKALGFEDRVFHLSDLTNEEVMTALKTADLYAMPNLSVPGDYEGFGLVALEAVTAGLVCVAANIDGIPSAIQDGENGILLPSGAVEQWIDEIKGLLSDHERRNELASQFKTNATTQCLSWREMAEAYEEVFQKVVNRVQ